MATSTPSKRNATIFADTITVSGDTVIGGNLTVSGTTTTINTETINLADNIIVLNSNASGAATEDAGIEIERGTDTNVSLLWDETNNRWTVGSSNFVASTFIGALSGNASTASSAAKWTTARTLSLTGAVTGSVSIDGSGNVSITTTATSDPTLTLTGDVTGSATFTNLGNATLTATVANDSHSHSNYLLKTGDTSSGMRVFYTSLTNNDDYLNSPISIKERGNAGAGDGEDRDAPNLNFHWGGRVSNSLWMNASGQLTWGSYSASGIPAVDGTFRAGNMLVGSNTVFHDGYHPNADKWTTARTNTVTLTGDVTGTGSASVDGSGNWTVSLSTVVGDDSHSHSNYVEQLGETGSPNYQASSSRRVNPNASNPTNEHYAVTTFGNEGNVTGQLATHFVSGEAYTRGYNTGWSAWRRQWDSLNHGSGSGLDADLLDGQHGSYYAPASSLGNYVLKTGDTMTGTLNYRMLQNQQTSNYDTAGDYSGFSVFYGTSSATSKPSGTDHAVITLSYSTAWQVQEAADWRTNARYIRKQENGTWSSWQRIFADDYHPNADKWTTARTNTVTLTGSVTGSGSASVDGSGNWTVTVPTTTNHTHNYDNYVSWTAEDGDGTQYTVTSGDVLKFAEGSAIDVNFTADDVLTISHADTSSQASVNNSNGTVIQDVTLDGFGHVTGLASVDLDSRYTFLDHVRSLAVPAFTAGGGSNNSTTTSALISEMEGDGAFDSYTSFFKTSWSYATNDDLTDAGRFTETAGTSWITWTDNSSDTTRGNITALAIAPNTGGSAGKVFIYNDQGSTYSPGWREVWTSASDGSGSGLDADLLDGQHGSYYAPASHGHSNYVTSNASDSISAGVTYTWSATDTQGLVFENASYTGKYLYIGGWSSSNSNSISRIRNSNSNLHIDCAADGHLYLNHYSDGIVYMQSGNFTFNSSNIGQTTGSWRAPIFYDSNDTGRYLDPNSSTISLKASGALELYRAAGNDAISIINGARINLLSGSGYAFDNYFYGGTDNYVKLEGVASSGLHISNASSGSAILLADGSVRSPIFYDSNNTGYYADPASTSNLNALVTNGKLTAHQFQIDRNTSNAALWFQEGNLDTNHVLWNDYYGGPTTRGSAGSGFDGIKWNTFRGIHLRGGLAGAYNMIVCENSSGTANDHVVKLYAANTLQFQTASGYALANNQMRAPIFYDSDNTGYYVNPNGNSNVSGEFSVFQSGTSGFRILSPSTTQSLWVRAGYDTDGTATAAVSLYNIMFQSSGSSGGTFTFVSGNTKSLTIESNYATGAGSLRAPIFYDSNNTGYYADPASTSEFNRVNAGNFSVNAGDGRGIGFWDGQGGDNYSIYMSSTGNGTHGGRVSGETTSDYNMYFKMTGGTNRGFVFRNNTTNVAGIDASGNGRFTGSATASNFNLPLGGAITFYGDNNVQHSIVSKDQAGTNADDLRINSYGSVILNIDSNNNQTSGSFFTIGRHGAASSQIDYLFYISGENADVTSEGNITAYGTISDIRKKENIENIPDAVEKVKKLNGVTFNYKKDGSRSTGLIAQELLEVLPEVVYTTKPIDEEEHYAVRYGNVVGLLVEAIKEQQTQIDELKAQVQSLKEK